MTELEAYPDGRKYSERVLTKYKAGDIVKVGPGYRMGGAYEIDSADHWSGNYRVLSQILDTPDYKLMHEGHTRSCSPVATDYCYQWDVIMHASRLTLVSHGS